MGKKQYEIIDHHRWLMKALNLIIFGGIDSFVYHFTTQLNTTNYIARTLS